MATDRFTYVHAPRLDIVALVPDGVHNVLEVGCNTGGFAEALKQQREGIEIWGVEPDAEAAQVARTYMDRVVEGLFGPALGLPAHYFDTIVFNDVLEHMPDPWTALKDATGLLRPGGAVIGSLPNLRHHETLWHLFVDRDFRYEPEGVRDRTHLRFFTMKSAARMFEQSGYDIVRLEFITERWWTRSIVRRAAYKLFSRWIEDTKYVQLAFVIQPHH